MGYLTVAPAIQPYFKVSANEKGDLSNWSERHIAYVAGHGTFNLSDGFITERGIYTRIVIEGPPVPSVKYTITSFRMADPPSARSSTEATVKCIPSGRSGAVPYISVLKSESISGRRFSRQTLAVVTFVPSVHTSGSGRVYDGTFDSS